MTWPLEPVGIREFARGLEDIVVVEEKRGFIERADEGTDVQLADRAGRVRRSSASTTKPANGSCRPPTS